MDRIETVAPRPSMLAVVSALATLAISAIVASGCARKIGDECTTAADCNPNGTRSCDSSQPGGYCTIQGCNQTSCPDESACIRYFPAQYLTEACNPSMPATDCAADEFCLPEGLCAQLSQELRYCAKTCSSGDDCRGGYECRLAGTRGSVPFTSDLHPNVHFCAPVAN